MNDASMIHGQTLRGVVLGVSISMDEGAMGNGVGESQVADTVRRMSDAVLALGGGLAFGHDWRPGGVMEEVLNIALERRNVGNPKVPALRNLVPWPDEPALDQAERAQLRPHLLVERAGLPLELRKFGNPVPKARSDEALSLRAYGLTHLRDQLTGLSTARFCAGGRHGGSSGRMPGILEEGLLAIQAGQPLYLTSLFGGSSARMVAAIEADPGPCPPDFVPVRPDIEAALSRWKPDPESGFGPVSPQCVWDEFNRRSVADLSGLNGNGLKKSENRALFHAQSIQAVVHLVIRGLVRLSS